MAEEHFHHIQNPETTPFNKDSFPLDAKSIRKQNLVVIDGNHRVTVFKELKIEKFMCQVFKVVIMEKMHTNLLIGVQSNCY